MKTVNKRIMLLVAATGIFSLVLLLLMYSMFSHAEEYAMNSVNAHIYSNGVLVSAGSIKDSKGRLVAYTENSKRIYGYDADSRRVLLHILGDDLGFISGGIQDAFGSELSGYSLIYGVNTPGKSTMTLTLDTELCSFAYDALGGYKGCIAVCNYKTGEIVCLASAPAYDMYDRPDDIDGNPDYEGVYINRVFGGLYTPGSTFKLITALAAIENDPEIFSKTFYCDGSYDTGDGKVICHDVHGTVTFKQALNVSCNCAFAQIAVSLGADKLHEAFDKAGLSASPTTIDRISVKAGVFDADENDSQSDTGWAGIGQSTTLVNPYTFLNFVCAVANNGTSISPYFVKDIVSERGSTVYKAEPTDSGVSLSASESSQLKELMRSNVSDYYGDYRFGSLTMCGKTGTAEQDDKNSHAWFVGFSYDESFPYAIVAILENSGSGLYYAGTAASEVMLELYNNQ